MKINLRTRLDAAEKELASVQTRVVIAEKSNDELVQKVISAQDLFDRAHERAKAAEKQLTKAKEANAELVKDRERLEMLANLIWETRWVSEDNDYQGLVGTAAEIRSGNFNGIDAAITKGTQ